MPRIAPFHAAIDRDYHDNSECKKGQDVPQERRLAGNEGKPLCKECAMLAQEAK